LRQRLFGVCAIDAAHQYGPVNAMNAKAGFRQKFIRGMVEYWINFTYLAILFSGFTLYRRLILAHYEISYLNYGISLIEAAVLAKVIMIGQFIGIGRGLEHKPLIFTTMFKAVVFSIFVVIFSVIERLLKGLADGKGLAEGLNDILTTGKYELLAGSVVIFFALIPFFAFKELERIFGEEKVREIFFRKGQPRKSGL
jgi:hypothetical protein